MDGARLISLADTVLSLLSVTESPSDELLEAITLYCESFEVWYASGGAEREHHLAREIEERHAGVLAAAERLLASAAGEIKEFSRKGKGIRAYTDVLPRKISFGRTKKG